MDSETRYLPLEKMAFTLVHATRKLPHYFQAHIRSNRTSFTCATTKIELHRKNSQVGTRLGSFDVRYRPRNDIKGQVLVDFVGKFTSVTKAKMVCQASIRSWHVYVDEASNAWGAGGHQVGAIT